MKFEEVEIIICVRLLIKISLFDSFYPISVIWNQVILFNK